MDEKLTLEEFTELVKEKYLELGPAESDDEAMEYFDGEEAQDHIKAEYADAVEDFESGKLGAEGFRNGKVSAVANCLYMMFE